MQFLCVGKWFPELNEHFRCAYVVMVPDNERHRASVTSTSWGAARTGIAKVHPRPCCCPDCRRKAYLGWIAADGTAAQLWKLVETAPEWKAPALSAAVGADAKAAAARDEQQPSASSRDCQRSNTTSSAQTLN
jgi:hypothetical protein